MRNRVIGYESGFSDKASGWTTVGSPRGRLWGLFVALFVMLLLIVARTAQLQTVLARSYQQEFEMITQAAESIPSRDARIVSADGQVLAQDVAYFQVDAYYRWLESPPDPQWLRMKARSRLSRKQRRDPGLIEAAEQEVIAQRDRMWQELATLAGIDAEILTARREKIQRGVERIIASAERRRAERQGQNSEIHSVDHLTDERRSWWSRAWSTVAKTLTTTPDRGALDPIVIKEQEDYHTIILEIDLRRGMWIEAHPERFPGLKLSEATRRRYPHGELAAHVVGYRTTIGDDELALRKSRFGERDPLDYRPNDRMGKAGIELAYERQLHGVRGKRLLYKNHRGEILRTELEREPLVRPDINLTLDSRLQYQAERLLDTALNHRPLAAKEDNESDAEAEEEQKRRIARSSGRRDCGARCAQRTRVLAAASAPRFNLDLLAQGDQTLFETAQQDGRSPFLPRVRRMALPPGSVFKTLSAAAILESGTMPAERHFFCQGYLSDPDHHRCYIFRHYGVGHGEVNLQDALARSCNVYFYSAARRSGPRAITDWAARFGFGRPTGIDLPGERGGSLPSLKTGSGRGGRWQIADTLGLAIGQSSLTVTPLQMARVMAVIGNGGYLVTPHVVSRVGAIHSTDESNDIGSKSEFGPSAPERISGLSAETLEQIHRGLVGVVENPQGTGYKTVRVPGIPIAGKTGTAEVGGGKPDHAWFAGYAPANQPQVAFVVVLQHAGSGGKAAGPLAHELVKQLVRLEFIEGTLEVAAHNE